MPKEQYYKLLGLPTNATEREVRKRYRLLAMKYHPDKNSEPSAQRLFIEITKAYEILLDKTAPPTSTPTVRKPTSKEDRDVRVKQAKQRYQEQLLRERRENLRYFHYLTKGPKWKTMRVISTLGSILAFLLILDLALPRHYEEDRIQKYSLNVGRGPNGQAVSLIETEKGEHYWISRISPRLYGKNHDLYVETSWFFHNPIRVISRGKLQYEFFSVHFGVFGASGLLIVLFLVPTATVLYKRMNSTFTLLYHISYFFVSALIVLFLLTGLRWAHVLTLGFL